MRHFLQETDFSRAEAGEIFALARHFKRQRGAHEKPLAGQTWAMIFAKSSTRTRVSFEVGIHELGGNPLFLNTNDIQIGRGETIADTAKVLSRFVHGLVVRTYAQKDLTDLAEHGGLPVVNALTDFLHPCQVYADAFTAAERWAGPSGDLMDALAGRKVAFLGDTGFNMANSWILGAGLFGMKVSLGGPASAAPGREISELAAKAGAKFEFTSDPFEAVAGADLVYTDVWTSMGQESEAAERRRRLLPFQVTGKLFATAKPDAFFMHCLPAHAGEEVTQEVLDNPRCVIFDEAENRLHVQKAILALLARHRA
ncbi:MAG: ornithine carbamoyltransferase [bacterium]|nr:ornithine carbamoyltransferase [bacterium]MDI1337381.1 ornithine carbamoyltransferase [Lacunisphaera sp.]